MYKLIDDIYDDYHNNYFSRPLYCISAYIYNTIKVVYYRATGL